MIWILALSVVILLVALAVISYPLVFQPLETYDLAGLPDESFSERDALLEAMSDLEQAHRSGKMSQADYEDQLARLELRYIQVVEGAPPEAQ